jgi:hypothetical protein
LRELIKVFKQVEAAFQMKEWREVFQRKQVEKYGKSSSLRQDAETRWWSKVDLILSVVLNAEAIFGNLRTALIFFLLVSVAVGRGSARMAC